jgi:hypothetical protein
MVNLRELIKEDFELYDYFYLNALLDDSAFFCHKRNGSAPTAMKNDGEHVSWRFLWLEYHF